MIDRLVHHAEILALKAGSYRLRDKDLGAPPARDQNAAPELLRSALRAPPRSPPTTLIEPTSPLRHGVLNGPEWPSFHP
jgi:hypothetical protein